MSKSNSVRILWTRRFRSFKFVRQSNIAIYMDGSRSARPSVLSVKVAYAQEMTMIE